MNACWPLCLRMKGPMMAYDGRLGEGVWEGCAAASPWASRDGCAEVWGFLGSWLIS